MAGNEDIEYTAEFITKLQVAFGKGFLSPRGNGGKSPRYWKVLT